MTPAAAASRAIQTEDHEDEEPRRPMWELAECTCPEFCERDHEQD